MYIVFRSSDDAVFVVKEADVQSIKYSGSTCMIKTKDLLERVVGGFNIAPTFRDAIEIVKGYQVKACSGCGNPVGDKVLQMPDGRVFCEACGAKTTEALGQK